MRISEDEVVHDRCGQMAKKIVYRKSDGTDGTRYYCSTCQKVKNDARKAHRSAYYRRKKYGLSTEEIEARVQAQKGKCPICQADVGIEACVDHDHESGLVRDILCVKCNTGLGMFDDDPVRLRNAAAYVEYHRNRQQAA